MITNFYFNAVDHVLTKTICDSRCWSVCLMFFRNAHIKSCHPARTGYYPAFGYSPRYAHVINYTFHYWSPGFITCGNRKDYHLMVISSEE
jgi:hypothetical protein